MQSWVDFRHAPDPDRPLDPAVALRIVWGPVGLRTVAEVDELRPGGRQSSPRPVERAAYHRLVAERDDRCARNELPGGIKLAVFPFTPTSERLARWVHDVARQRLADDRVRVACGRVFESLHPAEAIAEFWA